MSPKPGVSKIYLSLGAGGHSTYKLVTRTPMKAFMVTSMADGDRAVRSRPFTLRGNCARSGRTWQTIFPYLVVLTVTYAWSVFIITFVTSAQMCFIKSQRGTILDLPSQSFKRRSADHPKLLVLYN